MTDDRSERAKRLRELAADTADEEEAEALRDTAAEHDGFSLTGAATAREGE